MLDIVENTLQVIAYAIFNMTFVFGIWLIYSINKKMNRLDYYRTVSKKPILYLMSDLILQGIIVGVVVSLTLVMAGVPLFYNEALLLIIPISLVLSIYRIRFLCITYAGTILAIMSLLFNGQEILGVRFFDVEIHVASLLVLIGVLHIVEGTLVFLTAHKRAVAIISKKDNQVIMGHVMYKNWLLPLGLIVLHIGAIPAGGIEMPTWWPVIQYTGYGPGIFYSLFPTIGMLSFSTIVYNESPKERSRFSGLTLLAFGVLTVILASLALDNIIVQVIGILIMLLTHEGLNYLEARREKSKEPIYNIPEEGVRIMHIIEGGFASKVGMKKGDIIRKINDEIIRDIGHLIELIKLEREDVFIETLSLKGIEKRYIVENSKELEHMGIRVIPERPLMLHPMNQLKQLGIFEFVKRT